MRRATTDQLSFQLRATGLRLLRRLRNVRDELPRLARIDALDQMDECWPLVAGSSLTRLWTSANSEEWRLTTGKVHNLRLAVQQLHGLHIPAGTTFSFWRHVDRPLARNGYVAGRELREGCLVARIGGGLCQLSNGLYAAALAAGCEIIERHRHSKMIAGSLAEQDLDATIFWNYVDLRFRPHHDMVIEARLTADDLELRLRLLPEAAAIDALRQQHQTVGAARLGPITDSGAPGDCLTCGETSCVYSIRQLAGAGRTAWLLDDCWPEFDQLQQKQRTADDDFHVPLDGHRWHRPAYAWSLPALDRLTTYPRQTLWHARRVRAAGAQGATRQQALIARDAALAKGYQRQLAFDVDRLVISLNLLPHLWRLGALGGRQYTVLMTRPPLAALQRSLDAAADLYPQSPTLRDYRAPSWLVAAEAAALAAGGVLVTPHHELAAKLRATYGNRVQALSWAIRPPVTAHVRASCRKAGSDATIIQLPRNLAGRPRRRPTLLFAASSLGRKGAYELREALRQQPLTLRILGRATEVDGFWQDIETEEVEAGSDPLLGVDGVVLPAYIEHQPRLLLRAVERGIPVICSPACGLAPQPGVVLVETGDARNLAVAITKQLYGTPLRASR
jgi:hypothetical protein